MKSKFLAGIVVLLSVLAGQCAYAQVIDDSTRALYSPRTTLNLFEQDVLQGRYLEQRIDTSIHNMHDERYWYQDTAYYQHLGNVGTAAKPLFFRMPQKIGLRLGKNIFDRYGYDPLRVNYFDTRSPYSHLHYVQGQRGEQVFEAIHSRNITERWNAGVAYNIIAGSRQLGPSNNYRADRQLNSQAVKAFTHYRSKNERYHAFANYTLFKTEQLETGGVRPLPGDTRDSLFQYATNAVFLSQAANEEARQQYHLLQILKIAGENIKLYHAFDWRTQSNRYQDDAIPYDETGQLLVYPDTLYSNRRTDDRTRYRELQNEFGVTGNNKISYYKAFVKHRSARIGYSVADYKLQSRFSDTLQATVEESNSLNQLFVGGQFRLQHQNKALLQFNGEFQMTRDYNVSASAKLGGAEASLHRVLRSPALIEERILSNHYNWSNDFNNTVTDRLAVTYGNKLGERQFVRLVGDVTNIKRHIYFNEIGQPTQLSSDQRMLGARLEHHIRFGPFHFENFVAYNNTDEADKIRVPEWYLDSKAYFQGSLFRNALYGQFGVQMNLPKAYYADAYKPEIQQFVVQDQVMIHTYPIVDVFLTADIQSLNIFLKMSHVNQGLMPTPGYFSTYGYSGMRRSFIFGVRWMFFD